VVSSFIFFSEFEMAKSDSEYEDDDGATTADGRTLQEQIDDAMQLPSALARSRLPNVAQFQCHFSLVHSPHLRNALPLLCNTFSTGHSFWNSLLQTQTANQRRRESLMMMMMIPALLQQERRTPPRMERKRRHRILSPLS
jgi:hypothetical protein